MAGPQEQTGGIPKALVLLVLVGGGCMVAMGVIGMLAAIAVPSFVKYLRKSKVAEAQANVRLLSSLVEERCRGEGRLPGAAGPVPSRPAADKQRADWGADPVFARLGFAPADEVYYSYAIEPSAEGVELVAHGDLDGDGHTSELRVRCSPSCECEPRPRVNDELE